MPRPDPSHDAPTRVVALVVDARMRARLRDALPGDQRVRFASDLRDLRAIAHAAMTCPDADRMPLDAVVLQPHDERGPDLVPTVRWLRATFPPLPVLAYCAPDQSTAVGTMRLARAGVSQLLIRDLHDSPHALRQALAAATDAEAADLAVRALRPVLPPDAWPIVEHCLRAGTSPHSVADLSTALGVTRQSLGARLRRHGLPTLATLLLRARLLAALHRLERRGGTVEHTALALGFPSGTAFHNAVRRHLGVSVRELRARGGFAWLLALTRTQLGEHRP